MIVNNHQRKKCMTAIALRSGAIVVAVDQVTADIALWCRMKIRSVKKLPADQQAADALRESIVGGRLAPGTRLTEIALSDQLEVSRGTVRAALHQLATEGLIIQVPYTGWTVMTLTEEDAWELYTLRASLEELAASLVDRASDADLKKFEKTFSTLVEACRKGDRLAVSAADFQFHKSIVSLSGHRRLIQQYQLVEQQLRILILSSDSLISDYQITIDNHTPIAEAVLARNAELSSSLLRFHNIKEGKKVVNSIRILT